MANIYISNRYHEVTQSLLRSVTHTSGFGDNLLWWIPEVLNGIAQNGHTWRLADSHTSLTATCKDILLQIDAPTARDSIARCLFSRVPRSRRLLMRLEPPNIVPSQYQTEVLAEYAALVHVEPSAADHQVPFAIPLHVPAPLAVVDDGSEPESRRGIVAITSNKVIMGSRGKLYRQRIAAYKALAKDRDDFDLYGKFWDRFQVGIPIADRLLRKIGVPSAKRVRGTLNYKGELPSKKALKKYQYSLVIENYIGQSYVSEKLFDSLKYGVKVIYVGAPKMRAYNLDGLVMFLDNPSSVGSLPTDLGKPESISTIKDRYTSWLRSAFGLEFSVEAAVRNICEAIDAVAGHE